MKKYLIPYLYCLPPYWSSLDFHNDNPTDNIITIRFYSHPDGKLTKEIQQSISTYASYILPTDLYPKAASGRHIVRILGPDNLKITNVYKIEQAPWMMQIIS